MAKTMGSTAKFFVRLLIYVFHRMRNENVKTVRAIRRKKMFPEAASDASKKFMRAGIFQS